MAGSAGYLSQTFRSNPTDAAVQALQSQDLCISAFFKRFWPLAGVVIAQSAMEFIVFSRSP